MSSRFEAFLIRNSLKNFISDGSVIVIGRCQGFFEAKNLVNANLSDLEKLQVNLA